MPAKMARSAPRPPFGAPTVTAVVRAASPSCQNAAKAQKSTPVRGSSGESRRKQIDTAPVVSFRRFPWERPLRQCSRVAFYLLAVSFASAQAA